MKSHKYILGAVMTGLVLSCTPAALDSIKGDFVVAEEIVLSKVVKNEVIKGSGSNVFDIELASENGNTLAIQLVGKQPFADDATYGPASADKAGAGNYIIENTKVNGKAVSKGLIDFIYNGKGYEILGNLWTADDNIYRLKGLVNLEYVRDLEAVKLTKVVSTSPSAGIVSIVLATDGVVVTPGMMGNSYSGTGNYLTVDFYSANGKLVAGSYKPCAEGGKVEDGQYGIGWDPGDIWNIGIPFKDWGTCWWTVDGAAPVAQKILVGNINVDVTEEIYTISYKNMDNGICFEYKGRMDEVLPVESLPATEMTQCFSANSNVENSNKSVSLVFGTEGIIAVPGMMGTTYTGSGHYMSMDLYSEDGEIHEGSYSAGTTPGVVGEGEFGIGWDPGDIWGVGVFFKNWGTCWFCVTPEGTMALNLTKGAIKVSKEGGNWVIEYSNGDFKAIYTGEIKVTHPTVA